jgi:hypothetical protein
MRVIDGVQHLSIRHAYQGTTYQVKEPTENPSIKDKMAPVCAQTFHSLEDLAQAVGSALEVIAIPVTRSPFM